MATTSPDNLRSPNPTDPYNLVADLAIMNSDVQAALLKRANLYIGTAAQRNAFSTAPEGTHWQDTDGAKYEWVRQNNAWRGAKPIGAEINMVQPNASTVAQTTITFPSGYFASTPAISVTGRTGDPRLVQVSYGAPTAAKVDIYGWRGNTSGIDAMWIASPR